MGGGGVEGDRGSLRRKRWGGAERCEVQRRLLSSC